METETLANQSAKFAKQRNICAAIALVCLCTNLALAFKLLFQDIEVRLVPGLAGDEMAVSRSKVDHAYLERVTRDLVTTWTNAVGSSEKYVRDVMMQNVCPGYEGDMSQKIYERWDEIRRKKLQTVFHPKGIQTKTDELVGSMKGRIDTWIGNLRSESEEIELVINYKLKNGRICFNNYVEVER